VLLKYGSIRTLNGVFLIPDLARNLISISNMSDGGIHTVFEKETCKMILMRGVRNGTLYEMLRSIITDGCNNSFVLRGGNDEVRISIVSRENTML